MNHLAAIRNVPQITASTWLKSRIRNACAAPRRAQTYITIITGILIDFSFNQWQNFLPWFTWFPNGTQSQSAPQAITVIGVINIVFIINVIITTTSWASTHLLRLRDTLSAAVNYLNGGYWWRQSLGGTHTYDAVLLSGLQISNGDKVTLHHGDIAAVLARDDARLAVEGHLVVILQWRELLVGDLQGAFGNIEDLRTATGVKKSQQSDYWLRLINPLLKKLYWLTTWKKHCHEYDVDTTE